MLEQSNNSQSSQDYKFTRLQAKWYDIKEKSKNLSPIEILLLTTLASMGLLFLIAFLTQPQITAESTTVTDLIYTWEGKRVTTDYMVISTIIYFYLIIVWQKNRVMLPQGTYIRRR